MYASLPRIFNFQGHSLGRNRKTRKDSNKTKSTTTYAFLLRIVQGASYRHDEEIETVALFNESCNRNYVSSQFARNRLQILGDTTDNEIDGDCRLVWICEGLGRYQQRTVFWIAKDADFDLLFGYEKDQNAPDQIDHRFQDGIDNGTLKTELWKSFKGGIKDDYLLSVGRVADGDHPSRSRMPSLADIKSQLYVQLGSTSERNRQHDKERALNTYDPAKIIEQTDFFSGEDPNDSTTPVIIAIPGHDQFTLRCSVPFPTENPEPPVIFKGNKRTHHEPQWISPSGRLEELYRSPKVRNVRARCQCRCLAANLSMDEVPLEGKDSDIKERLSSITATTAVSTEECSTILRSSIDLADTPSSRTAAGAAAEEELVFSGMDRTDSPRTTTSSHDSSSISLSPKSVDIHPVPRDSAVMGVEVRDPLLQPKRKRKKGKRKRRLMAASNPHTTTADWTDKKFHEFWKRDEEKGNWYHVDEITNQVTWYEDPPWSTSPLESRNDKNISLV